MNSNHTAFVIDERDELFSIPIFDTDSSTSVRQTGAGLSLCFQMGDDSFCLDYDGSKWSEADHSGGDIVSDEAQIAIWGPLLPPALRTSGAPDDETLDTQLVEVLSRHADLLELYGTLVAGGWSVELKHSAPSGDSRMASISVNASAPVLDPDRAPEVSVVWNLPAGIEKFETTWMSPAPDEEPWSFDLTRTRVTTTDGTVHPVDPHVMSLVVIGAAPSWTLRAGVDQQYERHSAGGRMPATILASTVAPRPKLNPEEVASRRKAVDEWATNHGFSAVVHPATPDKTKEFLEARGEGLAGYYLLEFDNGDCYLGQSVSIADRLKGHRTLRKDISSIRPRPDPVASAMHNPLRHLLDHERALIASIQQAGLPARNKAQMTYLTGQRSLDGCLADSDCTTAEWLADPVGINAASFGREQRLELRSEMLAGGRADLELWKTRTEPDTSTALELIRSYLQRCLPLPLQTEYEYWTLSSPQIIPRWGTLSNLTIGWTEAFRINVDRNGHLSGWVQVNSLELLGEDSTDEAVVRFLRQHPGASLEEAPYQAAGPYNLNLHARDLHVFADLLDDTAVTRAAASASLHLMRHSKTGANRNAHNPVLVRAALGIN